MSYVTLAGTRLEMGAQVIGLLALLDRYGSICDPLPVDCPADLGGNGDVIVDDLMGGCRELGRVARVPGFSGSSLRTSLALATGKRNVEHATPVL
jgi:hypothetical protein